jgi:hypothetical protein
MTPDALPSPPRKRSWKVLIVALACVVAVITIVFLASAPKKEPVKVWFAGYTNLYGRKQLVFQGTNGSPRAITYFAGVCRERTNNAGYYSTAAREEALRASFTFTLDPPRKEGPYYVMWEFHEKWSPATGWERFRIGCENFFLTLGMGAPARLFGQHPHKHYIPSTEIKE